MTAKEVVIAAARGKDVDYVPSGFWLHFASGMHHGKESVEAHMDFHRKTGSHVLKVMNENILPCEYPVLNAEDWKHIRPINLKDSFVQDQLEIIKRLADLAGDDAVVISTIHGLVASAYHASGTKGKYDDNGAILCRHLREKPKVVSEAFMVIAEGLAQYAQECIKAGAQGTYYAELGGESYRFTDDEFNEYIKPLDLEILDAVKNPEAFNILHICKNRVNLARFNDYPCEVINWAANRGNPSLEEGRRIFPDKVILGGLDEKNGSLVNGSMEDIKNDISEILSSMGKKKFILGADCTLPTEISYERINAAIRFAAEISGDL